MNIKILNEEHRIIAEPMKNNGGLYVTYIPSIDAISINADCQNLEETTEFIATYLDLNDEGQELIRAHLGHSRLNKLTRALDEVIEIRNKNKTE